MIRGKVTEEGSGKPVAGARISFGTRRTADEPVGHLNGRTASGSDGSFQLAVLPSPGYLVVLGPSDDYVLREIDDGYGLAGEAGWPPLSTPTPSSPATRNRTARAWTSTSCSVRA